MAKIDNFFYRSPHMEPGHIGWCHWGNCPHSDKTYQDLTREMGQSDGKNGSLEAR
jgi:hypothetical protein